MEARSPGSDLKGSESVGITHPSVLTKQFFVGGENRVGQSELVLPPSPST